MNTPAFLGTNAGKLPFNYFSTLRNYGNYSISSCERDIVKMFYAIDQIKMLLYSVEKGVDLTYYHSHLLYYIDDENKFNESLVSFIKPVRTQSGKEDIIIKVLKEDSGFKSDASYKDVRVPIEYQIYSGKKSEIYIARIAGQINAAIYTYKFCATGLNNNFLIKD